MSESVTIIPRPITVEMGTVKPDVQADPLPAQPDSQEQ